MDVPQDEADELFRMEKQQADQTVYTFPSSSEGGRIAIPLVSLSGREKFVLDIQRGRVDLKGTLQTRAHSVVILARLCIGRGPHTNPDGTTFPCPHLHIYREGFGDKWATPLPDSLPWRPDNLRLLFDDFLRYCHVTGTVLVQGSLL